VSERDQRRLIALLEARLGLQWSDIVEWLRQQNGLDEIERRLVTGQFPIVGVEDAARQLADEIHSAYVTSGKTQAEWLDRQERTKDTLVRFDTGQAAVVDRQRRSEIKTVEGLTAESRDVVRQVLVDGRQAGTNPRQMATRIRDSIGLTQQQEQWVTNYRRSLEQQDYSRALGYELSGGHADRSVQAAARRGVALAPEKIDAMVEQYRANALTYRAETIARTEAQGAAEAGATDAIRQAVSRGDVKAEELLVEWHAGPATLDARPDHQDLDGMSVRFGEDFVLADGTHMSGPHDPRGGAKHNANCRCTASTRIDLDRAA
jgi:hypothetical protein